MLSCQSVLVGMIGIGRWKNGITQYLPICNSKDKPVENQWAYHRILK